MKTNALMCGLAIGLVACGGETGTVMLTVSGEEAATDGFPVPDGPTFEDGWSLSFDTLLVGVDAFALRGADGEDAGVAAGPWIVELTGGDAVLAELPAVGARRWEDVRYEIGVPAGDAEEVGPVDAAMRQRMIDEGLAILAIGSATKGSETITFEYAFEDFDVLNRACIGGDGTDGIVVPSGGTVEGQITLHWDHLFFDSLRLDDAAMRFDAMAAAADDTGHVTLGALEAQRLADLRGADGEPLVDGEGEDIVYDPGSAALPEPTLEAMVRALAVTVGHWNGEGHCEYDAR